MRKSDKILDLVNWLNYRYGNVYTYCTMSSTDGKEYNAIRVWHEYGSELLEVYEHSNPLSKSGYYKLQSEMRRLLVKQGNRVSEYWDV